MQLYVLNQYIQKTGKTGEWMNEKFTLFEHNEVIYTYSYTLLLFLIPAEAPTPTPTLSVKPEPSKTALR